MSFGNGKVLSSYLKHKLSMKSSTEGELLLTHDVMSVVLWSKHFVKYRCYTVKDNKMYQDNKITILMENNGRASSSKITKHIKAIYFFIKDRINQGDVKVE